MSWLIHQTIGLDGFYHKYLIHDLELVAIVFALKLWKPYLDRIPYKIYTIHPITLVLFPIV